MLFLFYNAVWFTIGSGFDSGNVVGRINEVSLYTFRRVSTEMGDRSRVYKIV